MRPSWHSTETLETGAGVGTIYFVTGLSRSVLEEPASEVLESAVTVTVVVDMFEAKPELADEWLGRKQYQQGGYNSIGSGWCGEGNRTFSGLTALGRGSDTTSNSCTDCHRSN